MIIRHSGGAGSSRVVLEQRKELTIRGTLGITCGTVGRLPEEESLSEANEPRKPQRAGGWLSGLPPLQNGPPVPAVALGPSNALAQQLPSWLTLDRLRFFLPFLLSMPYSADNVRFKPATKVMV